MARLMVCQPRSARQGSWARPSQRIINSMLAVSKVIVAVVGAAAPEEAEVAALAAAGGAVVVATAAAPAVATIAALRGGLKLWQWYRSCPAIRAHQPAHLLACRARALTCKRDACRHSFRRLSTRSGCSDVLPMGLRGSGQAWTTRRGYPVKSATQRHRRAPQWTPRASICCPDCPERCNQLHVN